MAEHMRTELVTDALQMAASNHALEPKCIMHTTAPPKYTSSEYTEKIDELDTRHRWDAPEFVGITH